MKTIEELSPPDDYLDPEWGAGGRVQNWRNYVAEDLREIWPSFTPHQKAVIAANAVEQSMREEWD